mgnify:CR=1 FL=1
MIDASAPQAQFMRRTELPPEAYEAFLRMDVCISQTLRAMEEMPKIYETFPGLIGLGIIAGHDSPQFREAVQWLQTNPVHLEVSQVGQRTMHAITYLNERAKALKRGGKAQGYIINALIAASRQQDFKPEQRRIWGDPGSYIHLLLSVKAIVKFLNMSAQIEISSSFGGSKTCAQHMLTLSQESGSPASNGFCALLTSAIEQSLSEERCIATFKELHTECARFDNVPGLTQSAVRRQVGESAEINLKPYSSN